MSNPKLQGPWGVHFAAGLLKEQNKQQTVTKAVGFVVSKPEDL